MNFIGSLVFMVLKRYMAGSTLNKNIYTGNIRLYDIEKNCEMREFIAAII